MPKRLTDSQVKQYGNDGYLHPIAVLVEDEVRLARAEIEAFEAGTGKTMDYPEKSKSYLLFDWADRLIRHPGVLDVVEGGLAIVETAGGISEAELRAATLGKIVS